MLLGVKVGESAIRKCMRDQLGVLRQDTFNALGQFPTMMGEIGIPFDLDKKKAYSDGDYTAQTKALDASLNACDGSNVLNYSIWTYCPDNSHYFGDLWNGEDLSVWSADDAERATKYRASTSQVDLVGRIHPNRSRATSKASSLYASRNTTPNASTIRLSSLNPIAPPTLPGPPSSRISVATSTNGVPSSPAPSFANLPPPPEETSPYSTSSQLPPPSFNSTLTLGSESSELLPINLNDGARAISAFCRPYPRKTVGTPLDINFDIRTSLFTLTILLEANEVSADPDITTEIYVPLIHYAAFPSRVSHQVANDVLEAQRAAAGSRSSDSPNGSSNGKGGSLVTAETLAPYLKSLSLADESEYEDPRALALKVKVSAGRWETEGQILKWYYPRPESGSITLKIEVERLNGPIPTWVNQVGVGGPLSFQLLGFQTDALLGLRRTELPGCWGSEWRRSCMALGSRAVSWCRRTGGRRWAYLRRGVRCCSRVGRARRSVVEEDWIGRNSFILQNCCIVRRERDCFRNLQRREGRRAKVWYE